MTDPKPPKCADCRTSVNVHPWGTPHPQEDGAVRWSYVWRCGPCQYKHLHPDATPAAPKHRKPRVPQAEVLPYAGDD